MTEKRNEEKTEHKCEECQKAENISKPIIPIWVLVVITATTFISLVVILSWMLVHGKEKVSISDFYGLLFLMMMMPGLIEFLKYIAGRAFYVFIDKDGKHVHPKPPSKDFQLNHQVLKIWLGGWFRRNELDGPGSAAWQVPRARIPDTARPDEWRVTVSDIHGQEITLNPWEILSVTNQCACIDGMLTNHRNKMKILDSIGFELVWIHGQIIKDKKKYGRSKAAQKIRQDIEGILDSEQIRSSGLYAKWVRQVEHTNQALAEREANQQRKREEEADQLSAQA